MKEKAELTSVKLCRCWFWLFWVSRIRDDSNGKSDVSAVSM